MSSSGRQPWDANDPYPRDEGPECDHEDYDADILTGIATCGLCGARWHQTKDEIERERQAQVAFDKYCEEWAKQNPGVPPDLVGTRPMPGPSDDELPF